MQVSLNKAKHQKPPYATSGSRIQQYCSTWILR